MRTIKQHLFASLQRWRADPLLSLQTEPGATKAQQDADTHYLRHRIGDWHRHWFGDKHLCFDPRGA